MPSVVHRFPARKTLSFVLAAMASVLSFQPARGAESGYQLPPAEVVDIIDAAPAPLVSFDPTNEWMMLIEQPAMPSIEDVSRRMLRLAGTRIDPKASGRFSTSFLRGMILQKRGDAEGVRVTLPDGAKITSLDWSHTGKHLAFSILGDQAQELWVASVDAPTKPKLLTRRLNTVLGGFQWMPDGRSIVCTLVPSDRGDEPVVDTTPTGPSIQESVGKTSPTRTYQDLLTSPADEDVFDHYAVTELAIFSVDGSERSLNQSGAITGMQPSPDGRFLLLTRIERPYSYLMTYRSFPQIVEVIDVKDGALVHPVAEIPMAENIPIEGVRTGPRSISWKTSEPATLVWAEALDGGDPNVDAEFRDQLVKLPAPFEQDPETLLKLEERFAGIEFFADSDRWIITEYDRDRRWIRSLLIDENDLDGEPVVLVDRSIRDRYGDNGSLVRELDSSGRAVVRESGPWVFRSGRGASPKGDLPFLDRQNLETLETERLWRCEEGTYESFVDLLDATDSATPSIITRAETKTTPANYFQRDLKGESKTALTTFPDPTPQIRGITKQLVTYERGDGVPLSATLYLPADYEPGTKLPLVVWAYPREFNDAATAAQISGSPSRFTRMGGITHLTLLTQGYAIMDSATMPVIGDPETMNDTFIEQIVDAAQAAIDKAVDMGVADRNRVAVGGHSYGAFMTANLLAHCDLFAAGIARSGAYNRTLTPFGFQSERRSFWDAKDIYFSISPFMHANKIKEPLLLIHGANDNNSGTFPIQSQRMYQAIKGNGGTVRLCMLPGESHGYRARESILHTQAEMIAWLETYVKNRGSDEVTSDATESSSESGTQQ
ncbi:MAG: prolyl oligopeptidase family serine peptidase [Planctomycetota bacterium]